MNPPRYGILLFLIGMLWVGRASAGPAETWQQTRELYDSGRVEEAFKNLQAHPEPSASYYYNLGTMAFRLSKPGQAVAYLEKAKRLDTRDSDISTNLRLARTTLSHALGTQRLDPGSTWIESVSDQVSTDEARAAVGMLALLLVGLWLRSYAKTRDLKASLSRPSGMVGAAGLAIGLLAIAAIHFGGNPAGALLEKQAVRSGPGDQFSDLGPLEAGLKVRLLGPRAATGEEIWIQVRFAPESVGWVRSNAILEL